MNMMRTAVLLAAYDGPVHGRRHRARRARQAWRWRWLWPSPSATNLFAYWNSDRMALASNDAQEVDASDRRPTSWPIVAELAQRAQRADAARLCHSKARISRTPSPRGATPQHAAVAVNTGLMQMLTREEIAGVLAHELAHIKNRDTLTMTITATLAGAISSIAQFGMFFGGGERRENGGLGLIGTIAMSILAPIAASIVQMAISRSREYVADEMGGQIAGNPIWLASALQKIAQGVEQIPNEAAEAKPAMAHMFIINPLSGWGMDNLFSTHPNTENRVAALMQQAQAMGLSPHHGGAPHQGGAPQQSGAWGSTAAGEADMTSGQDGGFLGGRGIASGADRDGRRGPWG
jgi:heat shock protein HtpX